MMPSEFIGRNANKEAIMFTRWFVGTFVAVGILSSSLQGTGANAAEIKVLSAVAIKPALDDLALEFERRTGHKVTVAYATAGVVRDRIRDGEYIDVAIMPSSAFDPLVKQGKIASGSAVPVARSLVAVAVRAGAPKPDTVRSKLSSARC